MRQATARRSTAPGVVWTNGRRLAPFSARRRIPADAGLDCYARIPLPLPTTARFAQHFLTRTDDRHALGRRHDRLLPQLLDPVPFCLRGRGTLLSCLSLALPLRGDPEAALLWVSKSQRRLSAALAELGFVTGQKLIGRLLKRLGFSLQANAKTREGAGHPDRDAQFEHINAGVKAFQAAGEPVISVDTKKKELVGDFKNGGRELRLKGQPEPVRTHDFATPELGKVAPYGVYDVAANHG